MSAPRTLLDTKLHPLLPPRGTQEMAQAYLDALAEDNWRFLYITPTGLAFFQETEPHAPHGPKVDGG